MINWLSIPSKFGEQHQQFTSRLAHLSLGLLLPILSLFCGALTGCKATTHSLQKSDRIVERVEVDTPAPPQVCDDPARPPTISPDQAAMVVYLFTEEFCDACGRELTELNTHADILNKNKVLVVQAVTQTSGSCFKAARQARKSPWPYAAVTGEVERNWAIRSTPTMWFVNPKTNQTIAYVEGEMATDEILSFLPKTN